MFIQLFEIKSSAYHTGNIILPMYLYQQQHLSEKGAGKAYLGTFLSCENYVAKIFFE